MFATLIEFRYYIKMRYDSATLFHQISWLNDITYDTRNAINCNHIKWHVCASHRVHVWPDECEKTYSSLCIVIQAKSSDNMLLLSSHIVQFVWWRPSRNRIAVCTATTAPPHTTTIINWISHTMRWCGHFSSNGWLSNVRRDQIQNERSFFTTEKLLCFFSFFLFCLTCACHGNKAQSVRIPHTISCEQIDKWIAVVTWIQAIFILLFFVFIVRVTNNLSISGRTAQNCSYSWVFAA